MKNIIIIFIFSLQLIFASTTQEVSTYLSLSHSEEDVISIGQFFDSMRNKQENNETNSSTTDTVTVYKEYLEEHISSTEASNIITLYQQPIMEQYVSEVKNFTINQEDMDAFLASLKEEPLLTKREDIVNEIVNILINEELQLNFYRSMMQRYIKENNSTKDDKKPITSKEKSYVESMKKSTKNKILYGTQVFSLEEMNELKDAISSSIFKKIKRVENEALVQIMNNYIQGIVSKPKQKKK